jgi:hypothetical protein
MNLHTNSKLFIGDNLNTANSSDKNIWLSNYFSGLNSPVTKSNI